jgi:peptidyl-prolyl cis-trans isomerase SurA
MRCSMACGIWLAAISTAAAAQTAMLDRIAVSVGNYAITEQDIDREIRLAAFENSAKPDFSPANRRKTAERMVDQRLVHSELELSRYLLPSSVEVNAALEEIKHRYLDDATYRRSLAEYSLTEDDLKEWLVWQATLVHFIDLRFRPGIQITDQQIDEYFNAHLRPLLAKSHPGQSLSAADYRDMIESTLTAESANQQVDQWLQQTRRRTRITYHDEVFQ